MPPDVTLLVGRLGSLIQSFATTEVEPIPTKILGHQINVALEGGPNQDGDPVVNQPGMAERTPGRIVRNKEICSSFSSMHLVGPTTVVTADRFDSTFGIRSNSTRLV